MGLQCIDIKTQQFVNMVILSSKLWHWIWDLQSLRNEKTYDWGVLKISRVQRNFEDVKIDSESISTSKRVYVSKKWALSFSVR